MTNDNAFEALDNIANRTGIPFLPVLYAERTEGPMQTMPMMLAKFRG